MRNHSVFHPFTTHQHIRQTQRAGTDSLFDISGQQNLKEKNNNQRLTKDTQPTGQEKKRNMSQTSQLFSWIGWAFVPTMATRLLQAIYYSRQYGPNSPKLPCKGSARFQRDFNWILTIIVGLYLSSLVYESVRTMEKNHYDTLGLKFGTFTQKQLKTNFRKASLQYHPDKAGEAGAGMYW